METKSLDRLAKLHPLLRDSALAAYKEAVAATPVGVHPYVDQTLRTFEESNKLYAQGRTTKGPIVTNAAAGQSYHNYGLALDFHLQINGKDVWPKDATADKNWMLVVNIFKKHGFNWGGDFKSLKDFPHLEMTFGYNWRDLLILHNTGKVDDEGYVIITLNK